MQGDADDSTSLKQIENLIEISAIQQKSESTKMYNRIISWSGKEMRSEREHTDKMIE